MKKIGIGAGLKREFLRLMKTNPSGAGEALGKASHTIADSFVQSHTRRDSKTGVIQNFQDYSKQDPNKHSQAENPKTNKEDLEKAQKAVKDVFDKAFNEKLSGEELRNYLRQHIFPIDENTTVGKEDEEYN